MVISYEDHQNQRRHPLRQIEQDQIYPLLDVMTWREEDEVLIYNLFSTFFVVSKDALLNSIVKETEDGEMTCITEEGLLWRKGQFYLEKGEEGCSLFVYKEELKDIEEKISRMDKCHQKEEELYEEWQREGLEENEKKARLKISEMKAEKEYQEKEGKEKELLWQRAKNEDLEKDISKRFEDNKRELQRLIGKKDKILEDWELFQERRKSHQRELDDLKKDGDEVKKNLFYEERKEQDVRLDLTAKKEQRKHKELLLKNNENR